MRKFNITVDGRMYEVEVEEVGTVGVVESAPVAAPVAKAAAPVAKASRLAMAKRLKKASLL